MTPMAPKRRSCVLLIIVLIASAQGCSNRLFRGQRLHEGGQLCSQNMRFRLLVEHDGGVVIRDVRCNVTFVVASPRVGVMPSHFTLDGNGTLKAVGKDASDYWRSNFTGAVFMELQNNGAFVAFHRPFGSTPMPLWNTPIEYAVRLGGGSAFEGPLEIFYNMQWNGVCFNQFNSQKAAVACRSIGLSGGSALATPAGNTSSSHIQSVPCTGAEEVMQYCTAGDWNTSISNCSAVRVVCTNEMSRNHVSLVSEVHTTLAPVSEAQTASSFGNTAQTASSLGSTAQTVSSLGSTTQTASTLNSTAQTASTLNSTDQTASTLNSTAQTASTLNSTAQTASTLNSTDQTASTLNSTAQTASTLNSTDQTASTLNSDSGTTASSMRRKRDVLLVNLNETYAGSGLLLVSLNGTQGAVCGLGFTPQNAIVACRTLGFTVGGFRTLPSTLVERILLRTVSCFGNETRIYDCTLDPMNQDSGQPCDNTVVALDCQPPFYGPQSPSPSQLSVCSNRLLAKYPIRKDKLLCAGEDNEYTLQLTDDSRLTLLQQSQVLWKLGDIAQGGVADSWQLNAVGQLEILDNSGLLLWRSDVPLFKTDRDGEAHYAELQSDGSLNVFSTQGVGGWSKPSIAEPLSLSWVGCVQDFNDSSNSSRDATLPSITSPQQCLSLLMATYRSPFVGVLNGRTCRSYISLNSSRLRPPSECNVPCPGDSASTCGAAARVSVYRVRKASNSRPLSSDQGCRTALMVGDALMPGEDLCSQSGNHVLHVTPQGTILADSDKLISEAPNLFVLIEESKLSIYDADGNPTPMEVASQHGVSFFEYSDDGAIRLFESSGVQTWKSKFDDDDGSQRLGTMSLDGSSVAEAAAIVDLDDTTCTTNLPSTLDLSTPWFVYNASLLVTVVGKDMKCNLSDPTATDRVSLFVPTECYSDATLPCAKYQPCALVSGEGTLCSFSCNCGAKRCPMIRLKVPGCGAQKKATICDIRI